MEHRCSSFPLTNYSSADNVIPFERHVSFRCLFHCGRPLPVSRRTTIFLSVSRGYVWRGWHQCNVPWHAGKSAFVGDILQRIEHICEYLLVWRWFKWEIVTNSVRFTTLRGHWERVMHCATNAARINALNIYELIRCEMIQITSVPDKWENFSFGERLGSGRATVQVVAVTKRRHERCFVYFSETAVWNNIS